MCPPCRVHTVTIPVLWYKGTWSFRKWRNSKLRKYMPKTVGFTVPSREPCGHGQCLSTVGWNSISCFHQSFLKKPLSHEQQTNCGWQQTRRSLLTDTAVFCFLQWPWLCRLLPTLPDSELYCSGTALCLGLISIAQLCALLASGSRMPTVSACFHISLLAKDSYKSLLSPDMATILLR